MNADTHRHNVTSTLLASFWWLFLTTCISVKHFKLAKGRHTVALLPGIVKDDDVDCKIIIGNDTMIYGQSA